VRAKRDVDVETVHWMGFTTIHDKIQA
jgi:hypothetical protein